LNRKTRGGRNNTQDSKKALHRTAGSEHMLNASQANSPQKPALDKKLFKFCKDIKNMLLKNW